MVYHYLNNSVVSLQCVLVILLVSACSHSPNYEAEPLDTLKLSAAIQSLSSNINPNDAKAVSSTLVTSTIVLANEYDMASPPRYHNLLVHLKLRDRGLCCHWAEDLRKRVIKLRPDTIHVDWLVTKYGKLLEHNSIVIYPANSTWHQGIVYDPWRNSGKPFWILVQSDEFKWNRHPLSGDWENLSCKI